MASIHTVVMQTTFIKAVTSMDIQSTVGISQCSSSCKAQLLWSQPTETWENFMKSNVSLWDNQSYWIWQLHRACSVYQQKPAGRMICSSQQPLDLILYRNRDHCSIENTINDEPWTQFCNISREPPPLIMVNNSAVERVQSFKLLGVLLTY